MMNEVSEKQRRLKCIKISDKGDIQREAYRNIWMGNVWSIQRQWICP